MLSCFQATRGVSPCLLHFTPLKSGWVQLQTPVEWRIEHMEYSCRTTLEERTQTQSNWCTTGFAVMLSGWWAGGEPFRDGTGASPLSLQLELDWEAEQDRACPAARLQAFCCSNPARQHRSGWRFSHQWCNPTTTRLRLRNTRPRNLPSPDSHSLQMYLFMYLNPEST